MKIIIGLFVLFMLLFIYCSLRVSSHISREEEKNETKK